MDLLAYWRYENYKRDLDEGAGFHFNSKQSRLHTAINIGESLWLITRVVGRSSLSEYRTLARLVIRSKTINSPSYKYGPFRVWGDLQRSQYFKVTPDTAHDAFELLRLLPLHSGTLKSSSRSSIGQAVQTIRGLTPKASQLLEAFSAQLPIEERARAVPDELKLEQALTHEPSQLDLLLRETQVAYSAGKVDELKTSYPRNRRLVSELNGFYAGRCQLCAFDSLTLYSVESAESHHIVYRSRGGPDIMENLVLLCPNHHTVIHATDATFDYAKLAFQFPNGRVEPVCINKHLKSRVVPASRG
jgi:5-methylcytosine-specific restriction enzyme A